MNPRSYTGLAQLVEHWSPKPSVGSSSLSTRANVKKKDMNWFARRGHAVRESYNELVHKVTWPSRAELTNSAIVVMIASVILAIFIFIVDYIFEWVMSGIYGQLV